MIEAILSWALTALVALAFVMAFAVKRLQGCREPEVWGYARSLIVAGWALLALRFAYLMLYVGYLPAPPVSLLAIGLLAMGWVTLCAQRLDAESCPTTEWGEDQH